MKCGTFISTAQPIRERDLQVLLMGERIGDRVRHHDRAGEMDDGVNEIAEQDGSNKVMVADVPFDEFRLVGDG
jgi:hypothetical protein